MMMKYWMVLLCGLAWIIAAPGSPLAVAEEAAPPKSAKKTDKSQERAKRSKARAAKLEAAEKKSTDREPKSSASSRFQMLAAGERVIVLDTQTGETRIIEPETVPVNQNVEIGKSWVTVTVLVNAQGRAKAAETPAPKKP
jgi:hypothetical protein